jgi:hypothetical protein
MRKFVAKSYRLVAAGIAVVALLAWLLFRVQHEVSESSSVHDAKSAPPRGAARQALVGALSGTARSDQGAAIAGVLVCAGEAAYRTLGGVETHCALSVAGGHYRIAELPAGSYDVSAAAAGYLPAFAGKERGIVVSAGQETANIDLALEHGGARLTGLVADATGGPIPGARLAIAFGAGMSRSLSLETDADGHFTAWLTPGRVQLVVNADGYAAVITGHIAPSHDLVIRLVPGSTLRGRVVAADDKRPVAGVDVRAVCDHCFNSVASPDAVSGKDGSFTIVNLDPGNYLLSAEGDGWRGHAADPLSVGLAQTIDDVVVVARRVHAVTGTVKGRDGAPCTRGAVSLGPPEAGTSMFDPPSTATAPSAAAISVPALVASIDVTGSVRFRAAPSGTYHVVVECEDQVFVAGPTTLQVAEANLDDVAWQVAPGLKLAVRVVDEADRPLAATAFFYTSPDRGAGVARNTVMQLTDANGRAETPSHLYPGKYLLEPYTGYDGDPVEVDLREGMGRVEATLRLKGRGAIEVRVDRADGSAVDQVRVSASPHATQANGVATSAAAPTAGLPASLFAHQAIERGEGQFELKPLTAGTYDLEVDDGVNAPIVLAVQVNADVVREHVVLDRALTLRGHVVDAAGQPASDVWVSAICSPAGDTRAQWESADAAVRSFREGKRVVSDSAGAFLVTDIARSASTCAVRAEEPGGSVGLAEGVKPGDDIVLSMRPLGAVSGIVQTADGHTVGPFIVAVTNEHYRQQRVEDVPNGVSSWTVPNLLPGELKLLARAATGEVAEQTVELAPGQRLGGVRLEFARSSADSPTPQPN